MISNISGFPEFLPNEQIVFNKILDIIKNKFELYGFSPMDTSAVEKTATLLSKGNDHEIYGIYRLAGEENNHKDIALRFDLTVPLARYVAQNYHELSFPYRRYHIAPVWRGERPQKGRYRQFYQCDIDIIGQENLSIKYDAEILAIIIDTLKAIGLNNFVVKINNRNILTGLIKSFNISDENKINSIIRIIDKFGKITEGIMISQLTQLELNLENIEIIMSLFDSKKTNEEHLTYLANLSDSMEMQQGINELREILNLANIFNIDSNMISITPSLARGLSYYTGTIYETILLDYPELGSICGGGRYANLTSQFSKQKLPGVGVSIGISRLIPKLLELGIFKAESWTSAQILVTTQHHEFIDQYIKIANILRSLGINCEIYLENKNLNAQMKYASKKNFPFVLIADKNELDLNQVIIRNMSNGQQRIYTIEELSLNENLFSCSNFLS
jgi:histidyl-tRNA synthetase